MRKCLLIKVHFCLFLFSREFLSAICERQVGLFNNFSLLTINITLHPILLHPSTCLSLKDLFPLALILFFCLTIMKALFFCFCALVVLLWGLSLALFWPNLPLPSLPAYNKVSEIREVTQYWYIQVVNTWSIQEVPFNTTWYYRKRRSIPQRQPCIQRSH